MIGVIQCADSKRPEAGTLRRKDGRAVRFVAHPERAPADDGYYYARPDDPSDEGVSWRQLLQEYNRTPGANPLKLLPAYELYARGIYRDMARHIGVERTFILSAGWGLIAASFLTPAYNITLKAGTPPLVRRTKADPFDDFMMIEPDNAEPMVFFGGKDYVPLFSRLTRSLPCARTVFYNSAVTPEARGCRLLRYPTSTRTNWQYECAAAFIGGTIRAD